MFASSIFFGLVAMCGWGVINFLIALLTKKVKSFKVAFLIQFFAFFPTLLLFPFFKTGLSFGKDFLSLSLLGIIGAGAYTFLTKGYSQGAVSIISPISSSWAVITAVLSFIILKEEITSFKIIGIVTALLGVILVSTNFQQLFKEKKVKLLAGTKWAILTAIGWGINFFLLAFFSRKLGWYFANLGLRFWSSLAFLGLANLTQNKFSYLLKNIPKLLWAIVVLDVFTFMMFNLGLVKGEPAVVSVIGSAAPLVSITLAALFLKEKLSWLQKVGILFCLAGIITLSLV